MDNYSQKKCGFCGENIPADAGRCPYCGSILEITVDAPYGMPEQKSNDPYTNTPETAGSTQGYDQFQPQDGENPPAADENQFTGNNDPAEANQNNTYAPQSEAMPPQYGPTQPQYGQTPPVYGPTPPQAMGQSPGYGQRQEYGQKPYYPRQQQQPPIYRSNSGRSPLSNGLKVFLTLLFAFLPGIGQIAGIITAIVFMSSDGDEDRRSFGVALLVANIAIFILSCLGCFLLYTIGESFPL